MKELKNGRSTLITCDGVKLKEVIIRRGFEPREVAARLEYSKSYFSKVFRTNKIGKTCVDLLKSKFDIDPGLYLPIKMEVSEGSGSVPTNTIKDIIINKRDEKKQQKAEPYQLILKAKIDPDQLKYLIKQAVLEAFEEL